MTMKTTWLVVGLGNPEGKYFQTYHNVGFLCAEALAEILNTEFKKKGNQLITDHTAADFKVYILKPLTYMNLSGQAVVAAARQKRITPENIIIFTDDLYIDKGNIRISFDGSSAGHNGIKSISELLGTSKYLKIRIGIKPQKPFAGGNAAYVLSRIDSDSRGLIDTAVKNAVDAAIDIINGNPLSKVQNSYNSKTVLSSNEKNTTVKL